MRQYTLAIVEAGVFLLFFALSLLIPGRARSVGIGCVMKVAGHNPARHVILTGIIALLAHLAVWPSVGTLQPSSHDEFSFLLMADTFASGRLANPVHPLWIFFESFHINQGPTYSSTYPPGQGIVLALGQLLGHPAIGVWIVTALMCASVCWMLQAWVPLPWALVGGMLAVIRLGLFSYWANSYWGGSFAALGGCLVWGAVGRLRNKSHPLWAALLALGLLIVANTRPYEGLWCVIPALGCLVYSRFGKGQFLRVAMPMLVVLSICGAAMLYYNWRVFGNPFELPYQGNRLRYSIAGSFLWDPIRPEPEYNHAIMRDFYTKWETSGFVSNRTFPMFLFVSGVRTLVFWCFYIAPALTLPFLTGLLRIRRPGKMMWPVLGVCTLGLSLALLVWPTNAHYLAPATGCIYVLIIVGLRTMYVSGRRAAAPGKWVAISVLVTCVAMVPVRVAADRIGITSYRGGYPALWYTPNMSFLDVRPRIINQLERQGGKHLVIVRYTPSHKWDHEYVYNRADIDASQIVWARELATPEQSRPLVEYYKDRSVWLFRPDESEELVPYLIH